MVLLVSLLGLIFAGGALWLALSTSRILRGIAKKQIQADAELIRKTKTKIWLSIAFAIGAGMTQAWLGDVILGAVWLLFVAVQYSNLGTVHVINTNKIPE
jgi:cell division protein FtsX